MHFTPKDWSFAYFSFLGLGKLILAGLSNRWCPWHRRKIFRPCRWHQSTTPPINFRLFGYFWSISTPLGKTVIAGVNDTGDNCSPVSLSPVIKIKINLLPVSRTPAITENPWQRLMTPAINLSPVSWTAYSFVNISANFRKKSKRLQWNTWGPGGHWFMKKTWSRKSRVRLPFSEWNVIPSLLLLNFVKIIIIITVICKVNLSESWMARLIQWRKSLSCLMIRRSLPNTGTAEVGTKPSIC